MLTQAQVNEIGKALIPLVRQHASHAPLLEVYADVMGFTDDYHCSLGMENIQTVVLWDPECQNLDILRQ